MSDVGAGDLFIGVICVLFVGVDVGVVTDADDNVVCFVVVGVDAGVVVFDGGVTNVGVDVDVVVCAFGGGVFDVVVLDICVNGSTFDVDADAGIAVVFDGGAVGGVTGDGIDVGTAVVAAVDCVGRIVELDLTVVAAVVEIGFEDTLILELLLPLGFELTGLTAETLAVGACSFDSNSFLSAACNG